MFLLLGLILGAVISYLAVTKVIALRGGAGMHGFVDIAAEAINNDDAVDLITCMKLAKFQDVPVDHLKLNLALNNELQGYDNGTNRAFNVLVYVKGYGVGIADSAPDKKVLFNQLSCVERFSGIIGSN